MGCGHIMLLMLCCLKVCSAPMAVIPGRLGVPRMQTFAQAWW